MRKLTFFIVCAVSATLNIFPQQQQQNQQDNKEGKTVEQRYLSTTSAETSMAEQLAGGETMEQKMRALDRLEKMINNNKVDKSDIRVNIILTNLAGEGTTSVVREGGRKVNDFNEVRRKSAELLGKIGGENSKRSLINITQQDKETMVLSEAVFALGFIGLNDNNESLRAIANVIDAESKKREPDDNLAYASLLAISKLAENGQIQENPDPSFIFNSIIGIETGNYGFIPKKLAAAVREKLAEN